MYLKEAFRYQNFLGALIDRTTMLLSNRNYITKTTQEHLRKKVNPDAEDETIEVKIECPYECSNNQLIQFLSHIMAEKEKLTAAISAAKRSCDIDIDGELANNRVRQRVARVLGDMAKIRPSENIIRGSAYKFNGAGNQVTYDYDVKQVTTIDFDRNKAREISRSLVSASDSISTSIDKVMVELEVAYEPEYSVNDAFEDVVAAFDEKLEEHS